MRLPKYLGINALQNKPLKLSPGHIYQKCIIDVAAAEGADAGNSAGAAKLTGDRL